MSLGCHGTTSKPQSMSATGRIQLTRSSYQGKPARDVAQAFIEKWNFARLDLGHVDSYPAISTKRPFAKDPDRGAHYLTDMLVDARFHLRPDSYAVEAQVLRSISMWSGGLPTEASIEAAYVDLIEGLDGWLGVWR